MSIDSFLQKVDAVIINPLLTVLFAVAFLYFLVSIIKLISADGNSKADARNAVMWSVIGMFIMISVYGIISLVLHTFQVTPPTYLNGKLQ